MSAAERLRGRAATLRRASGALCAGALTGTLLIAALAVLTGGAGKPPGSFDAVQFARVLPPVLAALSIAFLALGPLVRRLLRVAGLSAWRSAAGAGGLAAVFLLHALDPQLRLVPHLSHPVLVAIGAATAHAWNARGA